MRYLSVTIDEGIYYWREKPVMELPDIPLPETHKDNHDIVTQPGGSGNLEGLTDSDWAGDTAKRKSISGIIIMYAGGVIAYKSKFQEVIALSTTEAEFVAACDAAKIILFFRSILDDLLCDTTLMQHGNFYFSSPPDGESLPQQKKTTV